MSFWKSLFGKGPSSKNDLIRSLAKQRIRADPMAAAMGFSEPMVDSLGITQLAGLPESTIATIVETFAVLKKQGIQDGEIFARIEAHRATVGTGQIPQPLTLESYVTYRIALEHSVGAPVSQDFIAEAVTICRAFFHCPRGPEADDKADNERCTQPGESGPSLDASAMQFMAAMPHPEADVPVRELSFESENVDIAYYENPQTIGAVEIGIGQPYETPQVAVIREGGNPVLIVRTEKSGMGDLLLCSLDPSGVHGNYGSFEPTPTAPLDEEFISRAIEVFQSIKRL